MNLLIKDRGTGKTTGLLYASEVTGYPIVVWSHSRVNQLMQDAERLGIIIPRPLTVSDMQRSGNHVPENVLVDDAEMILNAAIDTYLNSHVVAATITDERKQRSK